MKISDSTKAVLKNFSEINPSLVFRAGNVIRTLKPNKTVMASAKIKEEIKSDAAVYDLSRFLGTLSLFDDPDINFSDKKFIITSGSSKVNYTYASEEMIITPPQKDITIPDVEEVVTVSWDNMSRVIKAAGVLGLNEIAFQAEDGKLFMSAIDSKNPTSDKFDIQIGESEKSFVMILMVENMRFIPNDYIVSLSFKGIHFKSDDIQYWLTIQS